VIFSYFSQQELSIIDLLRQWVHQNSRDGFRKTLLHVAFCQIYAEKLDVATVRLLLEANSDPNARDEVGNGFLHFLAYQRRYRYGELIENAALLLLKYGAHLDMVNKDRKTAADIWKEENKSQDLPIWLREPGSVPKLKCLSARIVSSNNVPYTAETLIEVLHPFVKIH